MSFGLSYDAGSTGDIIPILKYDSRAGRFFRVDRADGVNTPVDVTRSLKMVADLENVEIGWINFATGGAPDFVMTMIGQPLPPRPSPDHKQGVRIMVKLGKECGGDIREISTVAKSALRGLEELHTAYQASRESHAGQLPIVALKDTIGVTSGQGAQKSTNYQPVFEIAGWAGRPTDLVHKPKARRDAPAPQSPAPEPFSSAGVPPTTGSTKVEPPPAAQSSTARSPEPELVGADDDFG
jgi:hypothetical protein